MAIFSSIAVTELQREMPTSLHGVTSRQHETPISLIARSSVPLGRHSPKAKMQLEKMSLVAFSDGCSCIALKKSNHVITIVTHQGNNEALSWLDHSSSHLCRIVGGR
jgi:hypothetical protein